jgi:hypothetical protein
MEGSGLGLSPDSTRIVRWAIELTGAASVLIIFITRYFVKVSPSLWAILIVIPWIIFVIVLVYILIREEERGSTSASEIPSLEPESDCLNNMPDDFPGITLPHPDEKPGVMTTEEKVQAIENLFLKLAVMDGIILVVLYGIQILVPWWNEMTLLFIFMMMAGITIIYFNWKLKKITND